MACRLQGIRKTFSRLLKFSKKAVENSSRSLLVYKCSNGATIDVQQWSIIFLCFERTHITLTTNCKGIYLCDLNWVCSFSPFLFTNWIWTYSLLYYNVFFKFQNLLYFLQTGPYQALPSFHRLLSPSAIHILPNIRKVDKHGRWKWKGNRWAHLQLYLWKDWEPHRDL